MNPEDASKGDEALSVVAGSLWTLYTRLRAEGASAAEATQLAAAYAAAMTKGEE